MYNMATLFYSIQHSFKIYSMDDGPEEAKTSEAYRNMEAFNNITI